MSKTGRIPDKEFHMQAPVFVNSAARLRPKYVMLSEVTRILQSLHHRAAIHGIECLSSAKCPGFVKDVVRRLGSKWSL